MQTYGEYAPTPFDTKGLALPDQSSWLVVIGRNRDSDCLAESNFDCALEMLGGESETVQVHRFGHWACGWLEIILIDPTSAAAEVAADIESSLADYPVLNESDWSEREYNAYGEAWESWGASEFRRELVRKLDLPEDMENKLDDCDNGKLCEFFESLNPSGDYQDDGAPCIDRSVRNATIDDVTEFLDGLDDPSNEIQPNLPLD